MKISPHSNCHPGKKCVVESSNSDGTKGSVNICCTLCYYTQSHGSSPMKGRRWWEGPRVEKHEEAEFEMAMSREQQKKDGSCKLSDDIPVGP